ncbi:MAG: ParB/RepB/Spo0J family partition protein [Lachnospiraceae bacterium]|nr:ParB/RepB/Spo0J family partition protein [Lachnospiraceae bacterium]
MSRSIADRIKINHYADLFGGDDAGVVQVPIEDLHQFPGHPFNVRDDEDMDRLCESIRDNGIFTPLIVRVRNAGGYEIISGHRRTHAAKRIGLTEVPVIVKNMSDDEAVISMVDANLQRESLLPSEKAFSYKMKMDAIRNRGGDQIDHRDKKVKTRDVIGSEIGESGAQIQRYIRLTELTPELLEKVDKKEIPVNAGVMVSHIDKNKQKCLYGILSDQSIKLSLSDAKKIRKAAENNDCTKDMMLSILKGKTVKKRQIVFTENDLSKYFSENTSEETIKKVIIDYLEKRKRKEG